MHSGGMCTVHPLFTVRGCFCPGRGLCPGVSVQGCLCPGGSLSRGSLCPLEGSVSGGLCLGDWLPPVNRMTHRCKNITLPQTSFAGGNNIRTRINFVALEKLLKVGKICYWQTWSVECMSHRYVFCGKDVSVLDSPSGYGTVCASNVAIKQKKMFHLCIICEQFSEPNPQFFRPLGFIPWGVSQNVQIRPSRFCLEYLSFSWRHYTVWDIVDTLSNFENVQWMSIGRGQGLRDEGVEN